MANVIEAEGLSSVVPLPSGEQLTILSGASLTVAEGTSTGIVGRSGSGKTTLLTLLGLMHRPTSGTLRLMGRDVTRISDSAAAALRNERIGFIFQNYSLVSHLNVLDNVTMPFQYGAALPLRRARARALQALDMVGLAAFARRKVTQLSGGEQQRVAIARALVRDPAVLIADEPTGSLDTDTGQHVLSLLREASAAAGSCLVVVTHDPAIAVTLDERLELVGGALQPWAGPR